MHRLACVRKSQRRPGQAGLWVIGAGAFFKRLHIALAGGESEKAALMIEQVFQLSAASFSLRKKIEDDAGVEVAGACAHGNAARGSEAHGGVDRYPVTKRTETRSVTQMREDGSFGKLCAEMMHQRLVRNTVETIAANACVEVALRERKMRSDFRHRLMKSVVEAGKLLWPKERSTARQRSATGPAGCAMAQSELRSGVRPELVV